MNFIILYRCYIVVIYLIIMRLMRYIFFWLNRRKKMNQLIHSVTPNWVYMRLPDDSSIDDARRHIFSDDLRFYADRHSILIYWTSVPGSSLGAWRAPRARYSALMPFLNGWVGDALYGDERKNVAVQCSDPMIASSTFHCARCNGETFLLCDDCGCAWQFANTSASEISDERRLLAVDGIVVQPRKRRTLRQCLFYFI